MPAKYKTALTDTQKQTIAVLRTQGMSNRAIAARLGLHHITVSKAYSEFRREASGVIDDLGAEWKRDVKILVRAVKRGLTDESDNHKAGVIGIQTLKGLGELPGGQQFQIAGALNVTFAWQPVQEPEYDISIDVESKLLGGAPRGDAPQDEIKGPLTIYNAALDE
jgi:hypothetical protein